jgi:hypothetical protein
MPFVFTSQYAYEMGIWPWSDVFKSNEMGNMILSNLSAGPVGTGDAIGKENKENIMKVCRTDGVIVKPDVPLLPFDESYIQLAKNETKPILAYTYTKQGSITTNYVAAFDTIPNSDTKFDFKPADIGMKGTVVVYDPLNKKAQAISANESFNAELPEEKIIYYILAPITSSGIAFLGDEGKITATGKQRIASIVSSGKILQVKVLFAKGESSVTVQGYAEKPVMTDNGQISYDPSTHLFKLVLSSPANGNSATINLKTM